jgi:hypothetical protein
MTWRRAGSLSCEAEAGITLGPALTVAVLVVILVAVPRHYRLLPQFSEIVIGGTLIAFL